MNQLYSSVVDCKFYKYHFINLNLLSMLEQGQYFFIDILHLAEFKFVIL